MKALSPSIKFFVFIFFIICTNLSFAQLADSDKVESVVDRLPKLKKTRGNFTKYIANNVSYPDNAKLRGLEGDVWVKFVVTVSGVVKDVEVEKSVDPILDEAVVEFVKKTGPWKPGELNGKQVNTQMIVPVKFTLSENERNLADQLQTFNLIDFPPLFVLDNKLIDGLTEIEDYNVKSIRVIKGSKAIELYGEKAKNGVVVINSKRGTAPIY